MDIEKAQEAVAGAVAEAMSNLTDAELHELVMDPWINFNVKEAYLED